MPLGAGYKIQNKLETISEIMNPTIPSKRIVIAEIFEAAWNSSFVGFLNTCQTLRHFI